MSEQTEQNRPPIDAKHVLVETFAKFIAEKGGGKIIVMVAGGMYTGTIADHSVLEEVLAKGIDHARSQVVDERDASLLPSLIQGGHSIELRDVEFLPYSAPMVRFHFSQVFLFTDEIIGITTMTRESFPEGTASPSNSPSNLSV